FRSLSLAQIKYEHNPFGAALFEQGRANEDGNAGAVFANVFLFKNLADPGGTQLRYGTHVSVAPLRRGEFGPGQRARNKVATIVPNDPQKGVVGLENPTVEIANEDPDNVGVDQTTNLGFAVCEVAIEARIL